MAKIPEEPISVSPIVIHTESVGRFTLEQLKQNDKYIVRLIYPPTLTINSMRKLVLKFGDTIGACVPNQFKVKIVPIKVMDNLKMIHAEIENFGWYPGSFGMIERAYNKLKDFLLEVKITR